MDPLQLEQLNKKMRSLLKKINLFTEENNRIISKLLTEENLTEEEFFNKVNVTFESLTVLSSNSCKGFSVVEKQAFFDFIIKCQAIAYVITSCRKYLSKYDIKLDGREDFQDLYNLIEFVFNNYDQKDYFYIITVSNVLSVLAKYSINNNTNEKEKISFMKQLSGTTITLYELLEISKKFFDLTVVDKDEIEEMEASFSEDIHRFIKAKQEIFAETLPAYQWQFFPIFSLYARDMRDIPLFRPKPERLKSPCEVQSISPIDSIVGSMAESPASEPQTPPSFISYVKFVEPISTICG